MGATLHEYDNYLQLVINKEFVYISGRFTEYNIEIAGSSLYFIERYTQNTGLLIFTIF